MKNEKLPWVTKLTLIVAIPILIGLGANLFSSFSSGSIWINPGDTRPDRQIKIGIKNNFPFDIETTRFHINYNKFFQCIISRDILANPKTGEISSDGGKTWKPNYIDFDFRSMKRAIEHNPIVANQELKVIIPAILPDYTIGEVFAVKMSIQAKATNPFWGLMTYISFAKPWELDKTYYFKQTNGEIAPIPEQEWDYMNSEAYRLELQKSIGAK